MSMSAMSATHLCNFFEAGNAALLEAIALDKRQASAEAFAKYRESLLYFMVAIKNETSAVNSEKLRQKAESIFARCEALKAKVAAVPTAPSAVPSPAVPTAAPAAPAAAGVSGAASQWFLAERPTTRWDDVVGLENVKHTIAETFQLPAKFPSLYHGKRAPWRALLLFGPPGTGKTHICKAMACELDATFLAVKTADIVSKYLGDSEKQIKSLFDAARSAIATRGQPAIIFIDELDALCADRSSTSSGDSTASANARLVAQILQEMDGLDSANKNLFVVGATNLPWALDAAVLRRFPKRLYVPLPSERDRLTILRRGLSENNHLLQLADFESLAGASTYFSASDLQAVVNDVLMKPMEDILHAREFVRLPTTGKYAPVLSAEDKARLIEHYAALHEPPLVFVAKDWSALGQDEIEPTLPVTRAHVNDAMARIRPSCSTEVLAKFAQWAERHADSGA